MKSSVQQYISIFLVVCLFVFFGVGIASDGFTDFDVFKPMPVNSTAETEVEDCSYELTVQSEQSNPITWRNERVECGFTLASGDTDSDAGFSISQEGVLTFTNFEYALSKFDYDYLSDYEGQGYVSVTVSLEIGLSPFSSTSFRRLSFSRSSFESSGGSIDLVREVCKGYSYADNLTFNAVLVSYSLNFRKDNNSNMSTSVGFGNVRYTGFLNFLDRVDSAGLYEEPKIEEGYIFDGWYTDPRFENSTYYGRYAPSSTFNKFLYSDVAIDLYPKVSPAVTVSIDFGDEVKSIECAVGTSSLNSRSASRSSLISFFKGYCHSGDEFYTNSGIVITSDMLLSSGSSVAVPIVDFVVDSDMVFYYEPFIKEVTVTFYVGEEVFYTCQVERGSALDIDTVPVPSQPGYDFRDWSKVSDGTLFNGGVISENTSVSANFDLHYYTVTLNFPEGYTTENGRTSFTQTGVSHLTNNYYWFPYGDVFELVGADGLLYKTDGWITEDGADYDFRSPIYTDLNLYAKVVRLKYKVSYWYKDKPSAYAFKIVEYYPGDLVDYERDIAAYLKPGYFLTLFVRGSGSTAEQYFEYDYSPVDSNLYLYVKYTAIEYTVKFHSDYSLSFDSVICTCEENLPLPEVESRAGYNFIGWFYKDGSLFDENTIILSDLELYTKYQIQRKTVMLMSDGVVQTTFEVDYGTSLNDVLKQINYKNYNVVSFSAEGFAEESCFIDDVVFEVVAMDKQESIINTVKNKWQLIVGIVAGVLLLVSLISIMAKPKKKYVRKKR